MQRGHGITSLRDWRRKVRYFYLEIWENSASNHYNNSKN